MIRIHQTGRAAVGLVFGLLFFGGCGAAEVPDVIEDTSLIIEKEGAVISHTVGVFDRDYYDLQGLRAMAQEEAAAYNTANQTSTTTPVTVEKVDALPGDGSRVVVTCRYDSGDTYREYSGNSFFYGTVRQAKVDSYDFAAMNQVLFDAKRKESILSSDLTGENLEERHLALVSEPAYIYCPYKVAYVSEGASVREDGSVDSTGLEAGDFPVIILMNK